MEVLLALLLTNLFTSTPELPPKYELNKCYSSLTSYRPNTIIITAITNTHYNYKIYNPSLSKELKQKTTTLESVYNKQVTCPKEQ